MVATSTFSNAGALLMSFVAFLSYWKLRSTYLENHIPTIKHLKNFFGLFAIFELMIGLRIFIEPILGGSTVYWYIFGHLFLFVGLGHFSRIFSHIMKPSLEKPLYYGNIGVGVVFVAIMLYAGEPITALIGLPSVINWVGLGTATFLYIGWRREETVERLKLGLLGLGFLLIALAGPLHNAVKTGPARFAVNLLTVSGTIIAMTGVYARRILDPEN